MSVRVRFAPSPTGPLHMGGVRTALFNYLFARKHNGTMILRIEDTDQGRYVPGAEEYIMESLEWCGIRIDEGVREGGPCGPYRQSDRKHLYKQYADQLLESGWAYYAFDTAQELEERRQRAEGKNQVEETGKKEQGAFAYDASTRMNLRNSLSLTREEVNRLIESGAPFVIRFRMPENTEIVMHDLIRGEVRVNTSTLDDKVLFKSDGMPTYHLANVVDDHLMEITHVIRGEEWLPSMPLHVMLYKGFGWTDSMPQFAHLPLILKPTGNGKLSKRDGDKLGFPVFPINWNNPETNEIYSGYREAGYYPDAFVNILALLGWNDGTDKELYSMDELIEAFTLDRVGKSGSRFDPEKARWFNHQYLIRKNDEELAKEFVKEYGDKGNGVQAYRLGDEKIRKIISLVKERVNFVNELWSQCYYFFEAPATYDEATIKKRWTPDTPSVLEGIADSIQRVERLNPGPEEYESAVRGHIASLDLNTGQVMNVLRLCLVGAPMGPGVFDIMAVLGTQEVVDRIERAARSINQ